MCVCVCVCVGGGGVNVCVCVSGGFRAARLPGQATHATRAVSLAIGGEKSGPPNRRPLDWSVVCIYCRTALPHRPARQYGGKHKHN